MTTRRDGGSVPTAVDPMGSYAARLNLPCLPSLADLISFLICIEDGYRDNPYHSRQVGMGYELGLTQQLCSPSEYQCVALEDPPECM